MRSPRTTPQPDVRRQTPRPRAFDAALEGRLAKQWMRDSIAEDRHGLFVDRATGEVNATKLAEEYAISVDHAEWLDDELHPIWEWALEVADGYAPNAAMGYSEAKEHSERLDAEAKRTGRALKALSGGGPMGITPDDVRATPEWRSAKREYDAAFAALRNFNAAFVRRFKREMQQERRAKRSGGHAPNATGLTAADLRKMRVGDEVNVPCGPAGEPLFLKRMKRDEFFVRIPGHEHARWGTAQEAAADIEQFVQYGALPRGSRMF